MSWAAGRKITRVEDRTYSLLGIFGVNMPLLYGEGANAFLRLQEELIRTSTDASILAWNADASPSNSMLAKSPDSFQLGQFNPEIDEKSSSWTHEVEDLTISKERTVFLAKTMPHCWNVFCVSVSKLSRSNLTLVIFVTRIANLDAEGEPEYRRLSIDGEASQVVEVDWSHGPKHSTVLIPHSARLRESSSGHYSKVDISQHILSVEGYRCDWDEHTWKALPAFVCETHSRVPDRFIVLQKAFESCWNISHRFPKDEPPEVGHNMPRLGLLLAFPMEQGFYVAVFVYAAYDAKRQLTCRIQSASFENSFITEKVSPCDWESYWRHRNRSLRLNHTGEKLMVGSSRQKWGRDTQAELDFMRGMITVETSGAGAEPNTKDARTTTNNFTQQHIVTLFNSVKVVFTYYGHHKVHDSPSDGFKYDDKLSYDGIIRHNYFLRYHDMLRYEDNPIYHPRHRVQFAFHENRVQGASLFPQSWLFPLEDLPAGHRFH